jgi:ribosomal protein S18 acetylase RimI-like enzyme
MHAPVSGATTDDIDVLVALMHEFYAEADFVLDRYWAAASFERLLSEPELGGVWLARYGGKPAGYVVLTLRYTMEFGGLSAYVDDFFVKPEFRRRGLGGMLLDALLADSRKRKCKSVQVEVAAGNVPALAAYASAGLARLHDGRILFRMPLQGHA